MILVLAGTSEGREAAVRLAKEGLPVMASTATGYGGELLSRSFGGKIITGPLQLEDIARVIKDYQVKKVIDATHPFALEITENARRVCSEGGIAYERLERPALDFEPGEGIITARDTEEAVQIAAATEGIIFLTIGSNKLEYFASVIDPGRLVVRILPLEKSLEKCFDYGILPDNIIAMQGPFDEELNYILFKRYRASLVISKESGPAGGTAEKISAARKLSIPLVLISRPANK